MKVLCLIGNKEFEGEGTQKDGWWKVENKAKKESFSFHKDNKTVKILEQ